MQPIVEKTMIAPVSEGTRTMSPPRHGLDKGLMCRKGEPRVQRRLGWKKMAEFPGGVIETFLGEAYLRPRGD